MSVSETVVHVEMALIELDYLIADERLSLAGQSADEQDRSVLLVYKAGYTALKVCLESLKKAKEMNKQALVA